MCTRGLCYELPNAFDSSQLQLTHPFRVMKVHLEVWKKNYKDGMSFPAYMAVQPHLTQVELRVKKKL